MYQPKTKFTKLYDVEDVLDFGKYRGKTLTEVIKLDPDYVLWLLDREVIDITPIADDLLDEQLYDVNDYLPY